MNIHVYLISAALEIQSFPVACVIYVVYVCSVCNSLIVMWILSFHSLQFFCGNFELHGILYLELTPSMFVEINKTIVCKMNVCNLK